MILLPANCGLSQYLDSPAAQNSMFARYPDLFAGICMW